MKIRFGSISIGSVSNQSGVYYGVNRQHDVSNSMKENDGFGTVKGERNVYRNNIQIVFDEDDIDTWTVPSGGKSDEQ
ncbi:hypothetical protein [Alicyclobacillus sp. SO9]|uniref:hypothetical protein n=1 Tax=Alicyclobacillus sp. SO9 TaxID=2665646 RepID=UPI0018E7AB83|nr:hypothetical protein [Alicyclobacillus sp. SO9]QQE80156.1 hypothetical protein GI364_06910 [Alicyclobacillus sp. SO9]